LETNLLIEGDVELRDDNLENEIKRLIASKRESDYWDFKQT
jgi:hypothetical protein